MKFGKVRTRDNRRRKSTKRSGNANENEGSETTETRLKTNGQWTRPLKGVHESGNGGGAGQVLKHVGNEKEASEGASNDAVVASLGRTVGGDARVGASQSDSPERKKKTSWRGTAQQKLRLSAADFDFGDVAWRPVT